MGPCTMDKLGLASGSFEARLRSMSASLRSVFIPAGVFASPRSPARKFRVAFADPGVVAEPSIEPLGVV